MQEKTTPEKKPGTGTQMPETGKQGGQTDVGKKGGAIPQPGKTGGDIGRNPGDVGQTGEVGKQGR